MIRVKAKEGSVEFDGTLVTLLSEYSVITKELREMMAEAFESEEEAQRIIKRACDIGCMSNEEINKEIELNKEKFEKSEVGKIIGILFSGGMKHDAD